MVISRITHNKSCHQVIVSFVVVGRDDAGGSNTHLQNRFIRIQYKMLTKAKTEVTQSLTIISINPCVCDLCVCVCVCVYAGNFRAG